MILRHFVSKDEYTEHHSYRVSVYAARIAAHLKLSPERIEDVRAASLLHDIGKLDDQPRAAVQGRSSDERRVPGNAAARRQGRGDARNRVGGSLRRVIPIVLPHHDKFDGSGYHPTQGRRHPVEARIISVADVYDSLTSDRPYRKAMSPFEAKDIIVKGTSTDFDPQVVDAFLAAFQFGEMDVRLAVA